VTRQSAISRQTLGAREHGVLGAHFEPTVLLDHLHVCRRAVLVRAPTRPAGSLEHRRQHLVVAAHAHRAIPGR
jgi:hypothetical protein